MLVKDLIHLLNTRSQPDDVVMFEAWIHKAKGCVQLAAYADSNLHSIYRDVIYSDENETEIIEAACKIDIGEILVKDIITEVTSALSEKLKVNIDINGNTKTKGKKIESKKKTKKRNH